MFGIILPDGTRMALTVRNDRVLSLTLIFREASRQVELVPGKYLEIPVQLVSSDDIDTLTPGEYRLTEFFFLGARRVGIDLASMSTPGIRKLFPLDDLVEPLRRNQVRIREFSLARAWTSGPFDDVGPFS